MSLERCHRCCYQRRLCLCDEVPVVATRTRIVIVRHSQERNRSSNSGRLAHLALPNSAIVEYGASDRQATLLPHVDHSWLLFPLGEARTHAPSPPPSTLIILDATWSQARRMYRKLPLRGVPILRLPGIHMAAERLRQSPGPGQLSTIEAIAHALRLLEGDAVAAPLERLFDLAVARANASGRSRKLPSAAMVPSAG